VPDGEWDAFLDALRAPLPTTIRVNGSGGHADAMVAKLEADFFANFAGGPVYLDGEVVQPPRALPWYPHRLAWQMEFSRGQLRKVTVGGGAVWCMEGFLLCGVFKLEEQALGSTCLHGCDTIPLHTYQQTN
jgi:hypothetical protein